MIPSGEPLAYTGAFLGGVAVSLTPCVYPLIPVIVGFMGISPVKSKLRGFALSFAYVTGMAVTYSFLGLFASLAGHLFGRISSHPLTLLCVGLVFIAFGLSMLDVFSLPFLRIVRLPQAKKQSIFSGFILGLASGLVIGPCVGSVLYPILAYLATKKNIAYGASLLLTFAYGQGLIFILAGTSSSLLLGLPKFNRWLPLVKKVSAGILMAIGLYFIFAALRRIW